MRPHGNAPVVRNRVGRLLRRYGGELPNGERAPPRWAWVHAPVEDSMKGSAPAAWEHLRFLTGMVNCEAW